MTKESEEKVQKQDNDCCHEENCECKEEVKDEKNKEKEDIDASNEAMESKEEKKENEAEESKAKKTKKCKKKTKKDKEIEMLKEQVKELEEKYLRAQAELVNYRKRKDEEVARLLNYANEDLVKAILPMVDNFERAIKMDDENLDDEVSKFLEGFKLIYAELKNTLEKFEIIAIDGKNKPFDPVYHQAVMTDKVEGMEPGMVIEVLQKGYMLKDRVIRPAMVRVSE